MKSTYLISVTNFGIDDDECPYLLFPAFKVGGRFVIFKSEGTVDYDDRGYRWTVVYRDHTVSTRWFTVKTKRAALAFCRAAYEFINDDMTDYQAWDATTDLRHKFREAQLIK